jgi:phosphoribosylaminoimidazole-succinocarboxamide synthase
MEKRELIYEGKTKRTYTTDNPGPLIQYFKDDAEEAYHEVHHRICAA